MFIHFQCILTILINCIDNAPSTYKHGIWPKAHVQNGILLCCSQKINYTFKSWNCNGISCFYFNGILAFIFLEYFHVSAIICSLSAVYLCQMEIIYECFHVTHFACIWFLLLNGIFFLYALKFVGLTIDAHVDFWIKTFVINDTNQSLPSCGQ